MSDAARMVVLALWGVGGLGILMGWIVLDTREKLILWTALSLAMSHEFLHGPP